VTDTLPSSLTATGLAGTGWTCTLATLSCTRSDALAAGGSYPPITLTVNAAANAPPSVTNVAVVTGGGDASPANNTASDPTVIRQLPDLAIAKTHSGNFTQGQIGATYTLSVTNAGAGPTSGAVTVTDTLPAGLTATGLAGCAWTCTLPTLTWKPADALAASARYTPTTLTVDVPVTAPPSITIIAVMAGGVDATPLNNSPSVPTVTSHVQDLTLSQPDAVPIAQGQIGATYTLTVTNVGAGPTSGTVTVTDTLPAGLTATGLAGSGWTCTLATLTCTRSDALAAGASYPPITLTVNVAVTAPPSITNVAVVAGGGDATPG